MYGNAPLTPPSPLKPLSSTPPIPELSKSSSGRNDTYDDNNNNNNKNGQHMHMVAPSPLSRPLKPLTIPPSINNNNTTHVLHDSNNYGTPLQAISSTSSVSSRKEVLDSAKKKLKSGLLPDPLIYYRSLRPTNTLVRPSSLQRYTKKGLHLLTSSLTPQVSRDGLSLRDLPIISTTTSSSSSSSGGGNGNNNSNNVSLSKIDGTCFKLSFITAHGVLIPGIQKQPLLRLARICLMQGSKFISNIRIYPGRLSRTIDENSAWLFENKSGNELMVRCQSTKNMSLHIELNLSYDFDAIDKELFDGKPENVTKVQVDEVCCAWCTIPLEGHLSDLETIASSTRKDKDIIVPLMAGSLASPTSIASLSSSSTTTNAASTDSTSSITTNSNVGNGGGGGGGGGGFLCSSRLCGGRGTNVTPSITIRLVSLNVQEREEASYLPTYLITNIQMIPLIKIYRVALVSQLLANNSASSTTTTSTHDDGDNNEVSSSSPSFMAKKSSLILQCFPKILSDADIAYTFVSLWNERVVNERKKHSRSAFSSNSNIIMSLFCECIVRMWPTLHLEALPSAALTNDMSIKSERLRLLGDFARLAPSETIRDASGVWCYKPFDSSEVVYSLVSEVGYST